MVPRVKVAMSSRAVAVEVADRGDLAAEGEVVVPLQPVPTKPAAVGQGDVDVGGAAAGEGGDVVASVAVEVADRGDLVADAKKSCHFTPVPTNRLPLESAT